MNLSNSAQRFSKTVNDSDQVSLTVGPFSVSVTSSLPDVLSGIHFLYRQNVTPRRDFYDFHIAIDEAYGLRRWWRPQVNFEFDGRKPFKPLPRSQGLPFFEWGLNWCITTHCHEYLMIHAAVVEKNGRVLMLSAPPGAGKSTLCAGLVCRGWRLLSDELALLRLDGRGGVVPLARPVCLKNRSIDLIKAYAPGSEIGPLCHDTAKGTVAHMVAPSDSVSRSSEEALLHWIVFPRYLKGAVTRLETVSKAESFLKLAKQSFNFHILAEQGFSVLKQAVSDSQCYDFQYSDMDEAIGLFDDLSEQPVSSLPSSLLS